MNREAYGLSALTFFMPVLHNKTPQAPVMKPPKYRNVLHRLKLQIVLLLLCPVISVSAQKAVAHLSLDSCTAWALRNQAVVKNAMLDVSAARETRRAAFTKYFPSLSLMAGYFQSYKPLLDVTAKEQGDNLTLTMEYDGESFDQRRAELQEWLDNMGADINVEELLGMVADHFTFDAELRMFDRGAFANALLTQPIFAGGRIVNGNKLAKLGIEAAELKLIMSRQEVELNVGRLYYQIVSLYERQRLLQTVRTMLDTLERDASVAVDAGVMGRNDLLRVRLKLNELSATDMQLSHGIELATRSMCQYIGLPYDSVSLVFDTLNLHHIPFPGLCVDPTTAAAHRSESRLLDLSVEAAGLKKRMAVGQTLPQLAVGATYGINNLLGDGWRNNGLVFASLNIPVTAWWESAHNIRKENISRQQAENNRQDLQQKLVLQTIMAWNQMTESYGLIAIRRQAVSDAFDNLIEVKNYYDAGMYGMKDYLEAQTLLEQARVDLVDQVVDYLVKHMHYLQITR